MPLNWDHRADAMDDIENAADEEQIKNVEERILATRKELEVYDSRAWALVDEELAGEFQKQSNIVFATDDFEDLKVARALARFVSHLRNKPDRARFQVQELSKELRVLRGEEDAPEE